MILEMALLQIKPGQEAAYEAALQEALPIISSAKGFRGMEFQRCLETLGRYIFLVRWETLEDHTQGFRGSAAYQEWRNRLYPFYESVLVEHYEQVASVPMG
jgi:heme-degrading monooxygenase HmoA